MAYLVKNSEGKQIWVDKKPIWTVDSKGKEGRVGYLPDGTKVFKDHVKKGDEEQPVFPCPLCSAKLDCCPACNGQKMVTKTKFDRIITVTIPRLTERTKFKGKKGRQRKI